MGKLFRTIEYLLWIAIVVLLVLWAITALDVVNMNEGVIRKWLYFAVALYGVLYGILRNFKGLGPILCFIAGVLLLLIAFTSIIPAPNIIAIISIIVIVIFALLAPRLSKK